MTEAAARVGGQTAVVAEQQDTAALRRQAAGALHRDQRLPCARSPGDAHLGKVPQDLPFTSRPRSPLAGSMTRKIQLAFDNGINTLPGQDAPGVEDGPAVWQLALESGEDLAFGLRGVPAG
jgi:hypothetical protein